MSWDLEADVDLKRKEDVHPLLMAYLDAFGDAVRGLHLRAVRGDIENPPIAEETVDSRERADMLVQRYCKEILDPYTHMEIGIDVDVGEVEEAWPHPGVEVFGRSHPGITGRRRSDAVITFGNRWAYSGNGRLSNGIVLDESFVIDALKRVCAAVSPEAMFLHTEETVSFPLDYHLVYHRNVRGFAEDLREIVRLSKYGGGGYQDGRSIYHPALQDRNGETMMFAKRRGEWLSATKRFLATRVPQLEARGLPETLTSKFIEGAINQCTEIEPFRAGEGLGMVGLPLLVGYCDDLYFEMIERLVQVDLVGS